MQYYSTYIDMMDKMTIEAFMMIIMVMIDDRWSMIEATSMSGWVMSGGPVGDISIYPGISSPCTSVKTNWWDANLKINNNSGIRIHVIILGDPIKRKDWSEGYAV